MFIPKLSLFGLSGVHTWQMAQIFCSIFHFAQKTFVSFYLTVPFKAAYFHIRMSF